MKFFTEKILAIEMGKTQILTLSKPGFFEVIKSEGRFAPPASP